MPNPITKLAPKFLFAILSSGLSAIAALTFVPNNAFAGCAKATLSGEGKCENLSITLDASGCNDKGIGAPEKTCSGDQPKFIFRGEKNLYTIKLEKSSNTDNWGGEAWKIGSISTKSRIRDVSTPSVARAEVKPSITPPAPTPPTVVPAPAAKAEVPKTEVTQVVAAPVPPAPAAAEKISREPAGIPLKLPAPEVATPAAATSSPATPAAAAPEPQKGWSLNAFFDAYYLYNFGQPVAPVGLSNLSVDAAALRPAQNTYRFYDEFHRQFEINLVEFELKHVRKEVTFLADLDFGNMADLNAGTATSSGYVVDEVSKHIGQAMVSYSPDGAPGLLIEVGKMPTHVGLEVIKAKDNWNYSRSLTYSYAIPVWHTGVHIAYPILADRLTVGTYFYNGWNTLYDLNDPVTVGAQVKWTPSSSVGILYNFIGGPEKAANSTDYKQVHELNATLVLGEKLSLGYEAAYGQEGGSVALSGATAKWFGTTLAAKWQVGPQWYLSPRVEFFRDIHGYIFATGLDQAIKSATLTTGIQLSEGLETRVEGRYDISNLSPFYKKIGASNNQSSLSLSLLYNL